MTCSRPSVAPVAIAAVVALLALVPAAHAQQSTATTRAEERIARGQRLFSEGKFAEAIEELRAGYVLSPQPRFLYALGQAYRNDGRCADAVRAYREFIASQPARTQIAAAEQNIARCAESDPTSVQPAAPAAPTPPAPTSPAEPTPAIAAPVDVVIVVPPPHRAPVYRRWWLWTAVGAVAIGAGLGIGLGLGLHRSSGFAATVPEVGPNARR